MSKENGNGAPTLAGRQVAIRLKRHRERAGKSQEDAALALKSTRWKVWRIETARTSVKPGDILVLARIYDIPASEEDELLRLVDGADVPGWTDHYRDAVPDTLGMYGGLEGTASRLRAYDPDVFHGLLQSAAYARETFASVPTSDEIKVKRLAFRLERQANVLRRSDPPDLKFVVGEAAFHYEVGSAEIMRNQIEHVADLAQVADIRVWPFSAGVHLWMAGGAFSILAFPPETEEPEVVYTETHIGAQYMETPNQLTDYSEIFEQLYRKSVPIKEFLEMSTTTDRKQWIKARASTGNGQCVEMRYRDAQVEVRDTKQHGDGPTLRFAPGAFTAWIEAAKNGELDHLT